MFWGFGSQRKSCFSPRPAGFGGAYLHAGWGFWRKVSNSDIRNIPRNTRQHSITSLSVTHSQSVLSQRSGPCYYSLQHLFTGLFWPGFSENWWVCHGEYTGAGVLKQDWGWWSYNHAVKCKNLNLYVMCIITFEIEVHALQISTLKSNSLTGGCPIKHLKLKYVYIRFIFRFTFKTSANLWSHESSLLPFASFSLTTINWSTPLKAYFGRTLSSSLIQQCS